MRFFTSLCCVQNDRLSLKGEVGTRWETRANTLVISAGWHALGLRRMLRHQRANTLAINYLQILVIGSEAMNLQIFNERNALNINPITKTTTK